LIVSRGHDVYVARRRPDITDHNHKWNGVRLVDLYAPASKNLEAIVHTFLAVLKARQYHADILHIKTDPGYYKKAVQPGSGDNLQRCFSS